MLRRSILLLALQTTGCRVEEPAAAIRLEPALVDAPVEPPSHADPAPSPPPEPPVPAAPPPPPGSPVELLPVRWTGAIALRDRSELDAALADASREIGRFSPTEGPATVVRSCLESLRLHAEGVRARLFGDLDPYAERCRPLALLRTARPSTRSFVADLRRVEASTLRFLPAAFSTAFSDEEVERQRRAGRSGRNWRAMAPRLRIERDEHLRAFEARVDEGDGGAALVKLLAWGDFDGDGTEDLMVHVLNYATQGTAWFERLFVLTRLRPGAVLTVLSVEDGQAH